jgi:hypothetical protein
MYAPIQTAAVLLPLLQPSLPTTAVQIRATPIPVTGVVCTSPRDMAGLYSINITRGAGAAEELIAIGAEHGFRCRLLKNAMVFNWGPVNGPEGTIQVPGGKPLSIVEVVDAVEAPGTHYFLIAKSR